MLTTLITHAVAFLLGGAGGWYLKGRYGSKVAAIEVAVEAPPKP